MLLEKFFEFQKFIYREKSGIFTKLKSGKHVINKLNELGKFNRYNIRQS